MRRVFAGILAGMLIVVTFTIASLTAASGAVSKEASGEKLVIREVDTTAFPTVKLTVVPPSTSAGASDIKIAENGKSVAQLNTTTIGTTPTDIDTVLVLDTSQTAIDQDAISKVKVAAKNYIANKPANERVGLVVTGGVARTVARPSVDGVAIAGMVDNLTAGDKNALWAGLSLAAGLLSEDRPTQGNVILVTTSDDNASPKDSYFSALDSLRQNAAATFSLSVKSTSAIPADKLEQVAAATGGRYLATEDAGVIDQFMSGYRNTISQQVVVSYQSQSVGKHDPKSLQLVVSAQTYSAEARIAQGTRAVGAGVAPVVTSTGKVNFIAGPVGLIVIAIASFACIALIVLAIGSLVGEGGDRHQLRRALRPYSDEPTGERDISKIADSELMKRAVAATAKVAEKRGILQAVEARLQQADLPLKPAEALFFTAAGALVAIIIGFIVFGFLGMFAAALIFLFMPFAIINLMAARRRRKFTSQLPDTLQLLSGSLRAGYSFVQGLDAVAKQSEAPMGTELARAISEARLGRPVEEALEDVCDRMKSDDFEWAVMAIKIQREVGGNLAELLMTVAETMVARERLRREILALTAEGRMSAIILCALPFAIGLIIMVLNPEYMQPLLSNLLGQIAIAVAVMMIIAGYAIMNKMIKIEA